MALLNLALIMMNASRKQINWYIVFLVAFFLSEAIYKFLSYYLDKSEIRVSGVIKFFFQIIMLLGILINYKKVRVELLMLLSIVLMFFIGQWSLAKPLTVMHQFENLNKSLFIIIFILFFKAILFDTKQKKKALIAYEVLIITNSILSIIGVLTSIYLFNTYQNPIRFGFNGLIHKQSYATYFYTCALFYVADKLERTNLESVLRFLLIAIASVLAGTKGALLGLFLSLVYLVITHKLYSKKKFNLICVFLVLVGLFFKELIVLKIVNVYSLLFDVYKDEGLITMLFSFRNKILVEQLIPFVESNWNFLNYLFGGLGNVNVRSGLDVLDLIFYLGIIGAITYVKLFVKVFTEQYWKRKYYYFLFIILTVATLGGNFFYNSSIAVSLCAIKFYLDLKYEKEND